MICTVKPAATETRNAPINAVMLYTATLLLSTEVEQHCIISQGTTFYQVLANSTSPEIYPLKYPLEIQKLKIVKSQKEKKIQRLCGILGRLNAEKYKKIRRSEIRVL